MTNFYTIITPPCLLSIIEGANILTRSMITFGQGLNRAHPNLIKIVDTLEKGDDLKGFTREVSTAHLTYSILYLFQPCHNMT